MAKQSKITLIALSIFFAIVFFVLFHLTKDKNQISAYVSAISGMLGPLIPIIIEILKNSDHKKESSQTNESRQPRETALINHLNNAFNSIQENKFKKARASIQDFRLELITHSSPIHKQEILIREIESKSASIEKNLAKNHQHLQTRKTELIENIFSTKRLIEEAILKSHTKTRSTLSIASTIACFIISLMTALTSYLLIKSNSHIGLTISLSLFSFFSTCFIGLIFNQNWAKNLMKIAFGFFMAIITLLVMRFGGDGYMSY